MSDERFENERVTDPRTAEDFLLAAQAWATGRFTSRNDVFTAFGPDRRGEALVAEAAIDSANAQAHAAVATAMLAFEAGRQITVEREGVSVTWFGDPDGPTGGHG